MKGIRFALLAVLAGMLFVGSLASITVLILLVRGPVAQPAKDSRITGDEGPATSRSLQEALRDVKETDWRPLKSGDPTVAAGGEVLAEVGQTVMTRVGNKIIFTRKPAGPEDRVEVELFRMTITIPEGREAQGDDE